MTRIVPAFCVCLIFISGFSVMGGVLAKKEYFFSATHYEDPVKKIVKKIEKENVYVVTPNNSSIISDQERNYLDLLKAASIEELTQLASGHKNAVVRLYAFRALMESVKDAPKNIFEQFLSDSTPVKVIEGARSGMKPLKSIASGFLY